MAASGSQPDAHCAGATRGGVDRYSGRDRHGAKPDGARHSGSDNRALSSGAAAGLFAADGDLVWYWRNLEDLTDLSSDFCAGGDVGAGGGEKRAAGSHSCRPVAGCQPCAGAVVCHFARRAAGNPHRITHWSGCGLVYAGGGGADCRNARFRIYGSVSG